MASVLFLFAFSMSFLVNLIEKKTTMGDEPVKTPGNAEDTMMK